jgi:hypothetical protein
MPSNAPREVLAELAPTGVLRAGINLANFLLVSGKSAAGEPEGVAPDMARAIAQGLGVPVAYVPYARPGELADAAGTGVWDVGLIAAEPARAETIAFSPAYAEIEATYLVPAGSPIRSIEEVDRPGVRIALAARSAYDLWLSRHLRHAELVRSGSLMPRSSSSSRRSWTRSPASAHACCRTWRNCPAPGSSTANSPPCSRRSAPLRPTRPAPGSFATSSRTPRPRGWWRA